MHALSDEGLDLLFRKARTHNAWVGQGGETDGRLSGSSAYDLAKKWGRRRPI